MSIADDLVKKRTHVACDYDEFSLDSVKNGFVFKSISVSEIANFILLKQRTLKRVFVLMSIVFVLWIFPKLYNKCVETVVFSDSLKHA